MGLDSFAKVFSTVWDKCSTQELAESSFRAAGIYAFSLQRVLTSKKMTPCRLYRDEGLPQSGGVDVAPLSSPPSVSVSDSLFSPQSGGGDAAGSSRVAAEDPAPFYADFLCPLSSSFLADAHKGYHIFFDNFYTTIKLLKGFVLGIGACGTIQSNKRGFPQKLKDIKTYEKNSKRGDFRWVRDQEVLTVQWRDNKTISVASLLLLLLSRV